LPCCVNILLSGYAVADPASILIDKEIDIVLKVGSHPCCRYRGAEQPEVFARRCRCPSAVENVAQPGFARSNDCKPVVADRRRVVIEIWIRILIFSSKYRTRHRWI
jgi:hypothetical protein